MRYIIAILILLTAQAKAQDTTVIITPYDCDSTVTTELPERIYIYGYDTTVISGGSFTAYYQTQHYMDVIGDVTVITPLYDTIPAHDTTYVCSLCATCYDTSYIITLPILVVRANNQSKTYGQTFSFTNTGTQVSIVSGGLISGDVITADNAASTGATVTATAGTYAITLSSITIMRGATDVTSSYNITYQAASLDVGQRAITITANNQGKTAGQTFTFAQNGSQVSVTSGSLASGDAITFDNAASNGSPVSAAAGTYPITLTNSIISKGATNVTSSYNITYVSGTMTVAAAPAVITVMANNQSKTYGSSFTFLNDGSQVSVTSGSLISGDIITVDNAASTGSGSGAAVGSYAITLSSITIMRGATNVTGSYTITYAGGTLSVAAVPITVQANNQTKTEGDVFTFTNDGTQVSLVAGSLLSGNSITADNAASSGSGSGAADGTYAITLSSVTIMDGVTNVTSNYSITYQSGLLNVMPVAPVAMIYGMFPNPGGFVPFAQRVQLTKNLGNTAFRDNYDADNSTWKVEQVHDADLLNLMTYNAPECCEVLPFPTGSELTRQLNALDSTLTANADHLPDIISFNNEEPNKGYWSGLPSDYTNWLNAATQIAHNHGIPVSNGGVLQNIIWYIRWVYQQEGKTDSVAYINARTGYGPNTLAFQQLVIDWYKIEMPALMASNIDYINFHWYEPTSLRSPGWENPNNVNSASGLLPVLINFLGRYGKPVITTEFGTGNDSRQLFDEVCNQIKDAGVKVMVYYAGDGPLANNHQDWWSAFILQ